MHYPWPDAVKNQMLVNGHLTGLHHFLEVEFLQILANVRRLRPAWDELSTALATNNIPRMLHVDETVIQLVNDWGKKLPKTIKRPNKLFQQVPGIPPAHVRVLNMVLLPSAPTRSTLVLGIAMQNASTRGSNAPPANTPRPVQIQPPVLPAGLYKGPTPPPNPQPPIQHCLPASGNPRPSAIDGHNIPPLAMCSLKFPLCSSGSILNIQVATRANIPGEMFPQVIVNNTQLNNPPQIAGWANQIQAPC